MNIDSPKNLTFCLTTNAVGFLPTGLWNPNPGRDGSCKILPLETSFRQGNSFDFPESTARFSPPPFAVGIQGQDGRRCLYIVRADTGWHLWNTVEYEWKEHCLFVTIHLEGDTSPKEAGKHISIQKTEGNNHEDFFSLLKRGLKKAYPFRKKQAPPPTWWSLPSFCTGGASIAMAMAQEGPGPEFCGMRYNNQGLVRKWLKKLEQFQIPIGTVIIDVGWSCQGVLTVDPINWPRLKDFIADQHAIGRHVLLWLGMWYTDALPKEWCIQYNGQAVWADPTNPAYRRYLTQQVKELLSPDGYDADGFKIDMLQYVPSEMHARGRRHWHYKETVIPGHQKWKVFNEKKCLGCEMQHLYQKTIYDAAKSVKPDALINSSTVHPYFRDCYDMSRLHDTGIVSPDTDIFELMKIRAELARATCPDKLIDADNWVYKYYDKWVDYTCRSPQLGTPCIFFVEDFILDFDREPATRKVDDRDLRKISAAWRKWLSTPEK
ncbi:MAG: hypothetical protein GX946_01015 [Oligosphaeraceae bacterium]|nr:hypothetical protein [Oligosphaeraceae bacterium]